jgi:large subunit ribosomal protein L1
MFKHRHIGTSVQNQMSGKKQKDIRKKVNPEKKYSLSDALQYLVTGATAKFDESVDVAIRLGVDPKQSDQQVRGAAVMPHGTGKTVRVLAIVKGPKEAEAKDAGADFVGAADMIDKINGGWLDFDVVVTSPDMMGIVSKVGKVLGPRGLMPNPKLGTVTMDVKKAVQEAKAGKIEFRTEKAGIVHAAIGKISLGPDKIRDNLKVLLEAVQRLKPRTAKGLYFRSLAVSTTMGPGVRVDLGEVTKLVGA